MAKNIRIRASSNSLLLPLAALALGGTAVYLLTRPKTAAAAQPNVLPNVQPNQLPNVKPVPNPFPNPAPNPAPAPADLLSQAAALLAQVQANPASVDPNQLSSVASQLEAQGTPEASAAAGALQNALLIVNAARGLPSTGAGGAGSANPTPMKPDPAICTPGSNQLPAAVNAQIAFYLTNPQANPNDIDKLANQIALCGFMSPGGPVQKLRDRAKALRSPAPPPGGVLSFASFAPAPIPVVRLPVNGYGSNR